MAGDKTITIPAEWAKHISDGAPEEVKAEVQQRIVALEEQSFAASLDIGWNKVRDWILSLSKEDRAWFVKKGQQLYEKLKQRVEDGTEPSDDDE